MGFQTGLLWLTEQKGFETAFLSKLYRQGVAMKKGAMKKGFTFLSRIGLIFSLVSFCAAALAGGMEMPPPSFDGLSLIAGVNGVALRPSNMSWQIAAVATGLPTNMRLQLPVNGTGNVAARFGVEFGKNIWFSNFYLGANVNFLTGSSWNKLFGVTSTNPATRLVQNVAFREELTQNYEVDALLKIGYILDNQYLFFFGAGGAGSNVTFANHSTVLPNIQSNYKWVPGVVGAAGAEFLVTRKLILGVDYMYARYNSMFHSVQVAGLVTNDLGWIQSSFWTQRVGVYLKYMLNL